MSVLAWPGSTPLSRGSGRIHYATGKPTRTPRSVQKREQTQEMQPNEGTWFASTGQVISRSHFNAEPGDPRRDSCSPLGSCGSRWTSRIVSSVKDKWMKSQGDRDHDDQSRKQSSSTTCTTSSTATTLVGSEQEPNSKKREEDKAHHSTRKVSLSSLRSKLLPISTAIFLPLRLYNSTRHRHEKILETEEERAARRKAREEKR